MKTISIGSVIAISVIAWQIKSITQAFTLVAPLFLVAGIVWLLILVVWKLSMIRSASKQTYTRIHRKPAHDYQAQIKGSVDSAAWSTLGHEYTRVWTNKAMIERFGEEYCQKRIKRFNEYSADNRKG